VKEKFIYFFLQINNMRTSSPSGVKAREKSQKIRINMTCFKPEIAVFSLRKMNNPLRYQGVILDGA